MAFFRRDGDWESVKAFGYQYKRNVVFAQVPVSPDGKERRRDLMFDVYRPIKLTGQKLPAVIYVHGGAHHRGGRLQPPYKLDGVVHSRPEDYARLLAPLGYVVFVVEYRLALDNPKPVLKPGEMNLYEDINEFITPAAVETTSRARLAMGLGPLDPDSEEDKRFLWDISIAGMEDVNRALDFIIKNAGVFNIDIERIAMGGHSAGAGITANIGLGLPGRVAAILPMSAPGIAFDHEAVMGFDNIPPTMLIFAQNDEALQLEAAPSLVVLLKKADVRYDLAWVPGYPHFYPYNAASLSIDGTQCSLGDRIIAFLGEYLGKKP